MKNKSGFTLIELLVVIAIVGTLSTIITIVFSSAQKNARDQQRKSDLAKIQVALEVYYSRHGYYPKEDGGSTTIYCDSSKGGDTNNCDTVCPNGVVGCDWHTVSDMRDLITENILSTLPKDPKNNGPYYYRFEPDFTTAASQCGTGWTYTNKESCKYIFSALLEGGCIYKITGGGTPSSNDPRFPGYPYCTQ